MRHTDFMSLVKKLQSMKVLVVDLDQAKQCTFTNKQPLQLLCKCGKLFQKPVKSVLIHYRKFVLNNGTVPLHCGCLRKKWTNENIDILLNDRGKLIHRLTDVSETAQPSTTPILWGCDVCSYQWRATVDSIQHSDSGCPKCAGNLAFTVQTFNEKLSQLNRVDLILESFVPTVFKHGRKGVFLCARCNQNWTAFTQNVLKFGYGCPVCNANIAAPVICPIDGKFHSKLEKYFWDELKKRNIHHIVKRQHKYLEIRRLTCDFFISSNKTWVEISGKQMLMHERYKKTLDEKRNIVENIKKERFVVLTSFSDIHNFLETDVFINNLTRR